VGGCSGLTRTNPIYAIASLSPVCGVVRTHTRVSPAVRTHPRALARTALARCHPTAPPRRDGALLKETLKGALCAYVILKQFLLFNVYGLLWCNDSYNERRFQFRLVDRLFRGLPGFMGESLVIAARRSSERTN